MESLAISVSNQDPGKAPSAQPRANLSISLGMSDERNSIPSYITFVGIKHLKEIRKRIGEILAPEEIQEYQKFQSSYRQSGFLLARFAAKQAACAYLKEVRLQDIGIAHGVFNQPLVICHSADRPDISVSCTTEYAVAIAFRAGFGMGLDLDTVGAHKTHYYRNELGPRELALARSVPIDEDKSLAVMWTAKEALFRALKAGPNGRTEVARVEYIGMQRDGTFLCHYDCFPQYACRSWLVGHLAISICIPRSCAIKVNPLEFIG